MTSEKRSRPVAQGASSRRKVDTSEGADAQVAAALRSAYEEAVREDVPSEFLDLLGKLS